MEETLNAVGLRPEETLGRHPHQLSGGQRQRIMVARALLLQPRLIIADEPVSMVDASLRATILESLRQMHVRYGISILYITHDLTTAYQISDNILVMYRGEVAEAGSVEPVVKQPEHPYTQLLIQSIPQADPDHPWTHYELPPDPARPVVTAIQSCKFVNRCPHAMEICGTQKPPLFRTTSTAQPPASSTRTHRSFPNAELGRRVRRAGAGEGCRVGGQLKTPCPAHREKRSCVALVCHAMQSVRARSLAEILGSSALCRGTPPVGARRQRCQLCQECQLWQAGVVGTATCMDQPHPASAGSVTVRPITLPKVASALACCPERYVSAALPGLLIAPDDEIVRLRAQDDA